MLLLHSERQEVPERGEAEQGSGVGVLEGDRDGSADTELVRSQEDRGEEGPCVLQR